MTDATHAFSITAPITVGAPTVIDRVTSKLRNAIMQGELRPGQKLVEGDLAKQLGVSRASLREALRALESEKLIVIVPNRGPSVAQVDHRDIDAIHDVWALLAGDAVADFTRCAKAPDIAELDRLLGVLNCAVETNAPLDQLAATNRFLAAIMERHGNGVLTEVVAALVSRINFLRAQALLREGWGVVHARELKAVLTAIKARNPELARSETHQYIASACAAAKHLSLSPGLAWNRDYESGLHATAA